jgi:hypothetical protein
MLQSNNLSTLQNKLFQQTTKNLFTPQLRKITNSITDIASGVNVSRLGGYIKPKNRWIEQLQELQK